MIDAIFKNPQYQTLRNLIETSAVRHGALAGNVANVNTPGYHRQDLSSIFQKELDGAIKDQDVAKLRQLTPRIQTDTETPSLRLDGNNVNLEREMVEIAKNSMQLDIAASLLAKRYQTLRKAITGK
ncbi:MAG: flagellar basal body rod protein FlgB [Verrucomicrobiae bacterium]|nr:flagellar basal body rod protein FlgB [Verrucomicrobiae bacterium]